MSELPAWAVDLVNGNPLLSTLTITAATLAASLLINAVADLLTAHTPSKEQDQ